MSGKFALVFGNTQYADPALAQLTAPGKDAEDLARVLKDPGLCSFDNVTVHLNEQSSSAIETIDAFFDDRKPDDLLVLYFSGHGIRDELGSLYLAFTNTIRTRLRSTALKAEYIREAMDESRSKRQVLILDCCNSGAFPSGAKAELGGVMGMAAALQGYGRYVLTASDATQFAWEGDRVIGEASNSLFTHFLVKGLDGDADRDGDGAISVDDLYDYAFEQISRLTPKQTPTKSASKQEGEIILRRITRLEDIKPISLPDDLVEAMGDARTFVREGAVQQLAKLLGGRNLGLARSAREALEKLCNEDDSLRVRKAAGEALAPILAAEQQEREKAEQERLAREQAEAERLAAVKAQEELAAQQKAAEEQRAQEEAEAQRLAQLKAQQELVARQKAEEQRLARIQAEADRQAQEKAAAQRLSELKRQQELAARKKAHEEQRTREQATMAQPNLRPRWLSVLWIALGGVIGGAIFISVNKMSSPSSEFAIGYAASGLCIGLLAGLTLQLEHALAHWRSTAGIAVGWAVAWAIGAAITIASWGQFSGVLAAFVLSWALGGFTFGVTLNAEHAVPSRVGIAWITLAWAIGGLASVLVIFVASSAGASTEMEAVTLVVSGALGAAVGGAGMIWLIRKMNERPESVPLAAAKAQAAHPASENVEQNLRPRWLSILWIALGGGIGGALLVSLHNLDYASPELVGNFAFWGLCIGLAVALVLRFEHTLARWPSLVGIAVGWVAALAIGAAIALTYWGQILSILVVFSLSWAIGGFATGVALYAERAIPSRTGIGWITLGWTVGGVAGALVIYLAVSVLTASMLASELTVAFSISGAVGAAVGSLGMIWLIRKTNAKSLAA